MSAKQPAGIEPQTQAFLDALAAKGGPPINELPVPEARRVLATAQSGKVEKLSVESEDHTIPAGPDGRISIRVIRPVGQLGKLPVIMYFHGGGWVLGDKDTHDRLVREISFGAGAAVVFVNYTPSPEARYPVAIEQAYAATKWIASQGVTLNLDGGRLAVAGDSVGGNMAAAVTLLAKERLGPNILLQVLLYPVTDANFDTDSYQDFADGPWLTRAAMQWFWNHYAPDAATRNQPTASPLQTSLEQLKGLPPALVITDEFDVLRDEGEAYARKLSAAGVRVTATRYLGTIHDFAMLNALSQTPAARGAIAQVNNALRLALT